MSLYVAIIPSAAIGSPFIEIRSKKLSKCGLVKRPVRIPSSKQRESIKRVVVVLPFVPAICIVGYESCGDPKTSASAAMRSSVGAILVSGQRFSSAFSIASRRAKSSLLVIAYYSLGRAAQSADIRTISVSQNSIRSRIVFTTSIGAFAMKFSFSNFTCAVC